FWDGFGKVISSRAVALHQLNNHWHAIGRNWTRAQTELLPREQDMLVQFSNLLRKIHPQLALVFQNKFIGRHQWGPDAKGNGKMLRTYRDAAKRLIQLMTTEFKIEQRYPYEIAQILKPFLDAYFRYYLQSSFAVTMVDANFFTVENLKLGHY